MAKRSKKKAAARQAGGETLAEQTARLERELTALRKRAAALEMDCEILRRAEAFLAAAPPIADHCIVIGTIPHPTHVHAVVEIVGRPPVSGDRLVCEATGESFEMLSYFPIASSGDSRGLTLVPPQGWSGTLERGARLVRDAAESSS